MVSAAGGTADPSGRPLGPARAVSPDLGATGRPSPLGRVCGALGGGGGVAVRSRDFSEKGSSGLAGKSSLAGRKTVTG